MSPLQRQVSRARAILWTNLWLENACQTLAGAALVFACVVLVTRLVGWTWPMGLTALGLLAAAMVVSVVWSVVGRPSEAVAAAKLDEAAGLRERVSSSLYCVGADDPFAQAVCADAEERVGRLTVHKHVRLRKPGSWWQTGAACLLAALMFLVPVGVLSGEDQDGEPFTQAELVRTRVEVQNQMRDLKQMAETNPALADLKNEMDDLDLKEIEKLERPTDIRHEAIKKIDSFEDAVRKKKEGSDFDKVNESKRMMRALEKPKGPETSVQKLAQQLKDGDFKAAQETLKEIQQQLAEAEKAGDKDKVDALQKQLDDLSSQIDQLAKQEQLQKQLEQAGMKKEDIERMLENLSPEDIKEMKEQLQAKGLPQKKIDQLVQQMQKQGQACKACKSMAKSLSDASKACSKGQCQKACDGMQGAAGQLAELSELDQQQKDLDSAMQSLEDMKKDADNKCGQCSGNKDSGGSGGTQVGDGPGGKVASPDIDAEFKVEKAEVETRKGAIVGQFLVDADRGTDGTDPQLVEVVAAAERDASETVNRDQIPRQYQKTVKDYFARLAGDMGVPSAGGDNEAEPDDASAASESED